MFQKPGEKTGKFQPFSIKKRIFPAESDAESILMRPIRKRAAFMDYSFNRISDIFAVENGDLSGHRHKSVYFVIGRVGDIAGGKNIFIRNDAQISVNDQTSFAF